MANCVGWYLENTSGNHDKFYAVVLLEEEGIVVLNWGRRGAGGQVSLKDVGPGQAKAIALRQAYAKRSEGYQMIDEEHEFEIHETRLETAMKENGWIIAADFHRDRVRPRYDRSRAMVVKHYDEFVEKAQALMDQAGNRDLSELLTELTELEQAWAAIKERHDDAEVTISLTKQMLHQRLMSGATA